MKTYQEKGSITKWLLIVFTCLLFIIIGGYAFLQKNNHSSPAHLQPSTGVPSPKMTDLAPGVANSHKTAVTIRHSDSSYEVFLVPNEMVNGYIKSLPEGDAVVSQTPVNK